VAFTVVSLILTIPQEAGQDLLIHFILSQQFAVIYEISEKPAGLTQGFRMERRQSAGPLIEITKNALAPVSSAFSRTLRTEQLLHLVPRLT
jgi:hypothetical protein